MRKILIIKMGYSETLDVEQSKIVSLGDVIRSTAILEPIKKQYQEANIIWVVSQEAFPLVEGNPLINRVLIWDEFTSFVLMREHFDMVINLEKIDGICALVDMINAWEKVGFRFDPQTGKYDTYFRSIVARDYIQQKEENNNKYLRVWQEIIFDMLGIQWEGQSYSLGYQPKAIPEHEVGLNWKVGSKWPSKGMPEKRWKELESMLSAEGISVSWQQGLANLYDYMEWLASCRVIITNDSLGLHLALAMKKSVIGLFGPTDHHEVYMYGDSVVITPQVNYECLPCYAPECGQEKTCMEFIDLGRIVYHVKKFLEDFR